ncbi:MAG: NAD(P)-binding domain-containing protein [Saprospiraceae bacterium]|nr:NAD(P)-binding domain-containing protein [Saprospiraceae bacterium]
MKNVTIIGAGTMGNGIAQVFATNGFKVILCDISEDSLKKAMATININLERMEKKELISAREIISTKSNIITQTSIQDSVENADLIVEAATESVELKLNIFRQMDEFAPSHAILSTNTSSISITKIASITKRPEKVIGMHFMNPVPVMKLVEVIRGYATSDQTCIQIMTISGLLGKIPVEVNDYPGFVANRILMPMINEAIYTLYEGVATVENIDTVMKLGMSHPMGPLALADFIGLDVCMSILNIMHLGFGNPKYAPCPLLVNMVTAGRVGKKSGEGFYIYQAGSKETNVSTKFSK